MAASLCSSEFACGSLRDDTQRNFKDTKFTPYCSMEGYEAKVLEKNKDHNPGAYRLVRKECRIRKGPELIFPKMTFLIQNLR